MTPGWPCADSGTSSATLTCCFFSDGAGSEGEGRAEVADRGLGPFVEQAATINPHSSPPAGPLKARSQQRPPAPRSIAPPAAVTALAVGTPPTQAAPEQMRAAHR